MLERFMGLSFWGFCSSYTIDARLYPWLLLFLIFIFLNHVLERHKPRLICD